MKHMLLVVRNITSTTTLADLQPRRDYRSSAHQGKSRRAAVQATITMTTAASFDSFWGTPVDVRPCDIRPHHRERLQEKCLAMPHIRHKSHYRMGFITWSLVLILLGYSWRKYRLPWTIGASDPSIRGRNKNVSLESISTLR